MQRTLPRPWLNLLLIIAMVIGPWPVLSGTTDKVGDGCMMSVDTADDMRHAVCGSQPDEGKCCLDQGCSASNCSVTAYILPDLHVDIPIHTNAFAIVCGNSQPTGTSAPPTPPPIV